MWVSITQSPEGLKTLKSGERRYFLFFVTSLLELGYLIHVSCLQTGIYAVGSPGSQAFRLRLNHTIGVLGSPAFRPEILGLLSLHNHESQSLITN